MRHAFQPNTVKQPQTAPNPRRRVNNKTRQTDMYRTTKPKENKFIVQSRTGAVYGIQPFTGTLRRLTPRRHE